MVRVNVAEPTMFLSARLSYAFQDKQGLIDLAVKLTQKKFCAYTFFEMCNL